MFGSSSKPCLNSPADLSGVPIRHISVPKIRAYKRYFPAKAKNIPALSSSHVKPCSTVVFPDRTCTSSFTKDPNTPAGGSVFPRERGRRCPLTRSVYSQPVRALGHILNLESPVGTHVAPILQGREIQHVSREFESGGAENRNNILRSRRETHARDCNSTARDGGYEPGNQVRD